MKFLAILKDSFREAIDSKVLYVMMALSFLVVIAAGSISFRPLPGDKSIPAMVTHFRVDRHDPMAKREKGWILHNGAASDVRQVDDVAQPFWGEYRFTFRGAWFPSDADVEPTGDAVRQNPELLEPIATADVKKRFEQSDLEVLSVEPTPEGRNGNALSFEVHVRGTGSRRSWMHSTSYFFGSLDDPDPRGVGFIMFSIEDTLVNGLGAWFAILISTVITAFFIPNMLHKGTIDLLLAKPIGRARLLLYKYIGGLTFMFVNSSVAVGGVWFILSVRSGLWSPGFLLSILVLTFFFAILYSVSTLVGVLTRSAVLSILASCLMWFLFVVVGKTYFVFHAMPEAVAKVPDFVHKAVNGAHAVTPRTSDLDYLMMKILTQSLLSEAEIQRVPGLRMMPEFSWAESLGVSGAFIAVMLTLACWRFSVRDY
jgi:ABC-type transport system involved in multi-copper enzyme maturation permease subunit